MRNLFFVGIFLVFIAGISLSGCKKNQVSTPGDIYLYKTSFNQQEVITVVARNFKYGADVSCKIGGSALSVVREPTNDSVFFAGIPANVSAGTQTLEVTNGGKKYTSALTVNAMATPANPREYINNSISDLIQGINILSAELDSTDPTAAAQLRVFFDSLNQLSAKAATLSDADVMAIATYLSANSGIYTELETVYTEIKADPIPTSGEQKSTKTTGTVETLDRYTRYMQAVMEYFMKGEIKKGTQTLLLTGAVGTGDALSFLSSYLYAKITYAAAESKNIVTEVRDMAYWASTYSVDLVFDKFSQSISGNKTTQIDAEVSNNSTLGFKNVKITYRNMQPNDVSSNVSVLARLAGTYHNLVDLWNGLTDTYIDFGKIGFSSLKTKNKLMKNLNGISLSMDNTNIKLGAVLGNGPNFSTMVSLTDPNGAKSGVLTMSYTDDLGQTTSTSFNISVTNEETVTDIDGNVYHVVKIGSQYWLKENLKTSRYRNGDVIQVGWGLSTTTGACVMYNNDPANNAVYGKLYNWASCADSRGLAPAGWHVPSGEEFQTLFDYLGGISVAPGKLAEAGTTHWLENYSADNSSGFTGLPGGITNGYQFSELGTVGAWVSSTKVTSGAHVGVYTMVIRTNYAPTYGFIALDEAVNPIGYSVRCIKD